MLKGEHSGTSVAGPIEVGPAPGVASLAMKIAPLALILAGVGFLWPLIIIGLAATGPARALPRGTESRWRPAGYSALLLGALLLIRALLSGMFDTSPSASRIAGAAFSATVWLALGVAILRQPTARAVRLLWKGLVSVVLLQAILTTIAVAVHPSSISTINLPVHGIAANVEGLLPWSQMHLAHESWFGEAVIRSDGLQAQPVWAGGLAAFVALTATVMWLNLSEPDRRAWGLSTEKYLVVSLAAGMSVFYSYSRWTWLVTAASLAVIFLVNIRPPGLRLAMVVTFSLALPVFLLAALNSPMEMFSALDEVRPGSMRVRVAVYEAAITALADSDTGIAFGLGAKPGEIGGVPVGSHSTPVSLVTKGGSVAAGLYLLVVALLTVAVIATARRFDWVILSVWPFMWSLFEDFDVGHAIPLALVVGMWALRTINSGVRLQEELEV